MLEAAYPGLDLLATAVMIVDLGRRVVHVNPAAENLFAFSSRQTVGRRIDELFCGPEKLLSAIDHADSTASAYTEHEILLVMSDGTRLQLSCTVTPIEDAGSTGMLIEFRHIEQQLRIAREQQLLDRTQASRELIRNLAHEIRNPLGGIRGAAQLLARELERPELHDYTGVIMKEVDRLQSLMDRLLTPHRLPKPVALNIHEALERVRMLIVAEAPLGVSIERDYDVSLPDIVGDMEQIIQALLNIVRNAVQAVQSVGSAGRVILRTRVVRQITLARRRYRHAIAIHVIDDGPGIPDAIRDHIFYPLVSGRQDGSGLGLSLAQTFVAQHHGTIEVESRPGHTCFTILLPVETGEAR